RHTARTHLYLVYWIRHSIVQAHYFWRHIFVHRACDNHQIRMTRRWAENHAAKKHDIIPRRRCRDHLYRATSESELERPNRVFAPPVVKLLHRSHPDPLLLQFATQAFVDSFAHFSTLTP